MGIMCKTKKITVEGLGEIEARELTMEQFKTVREAAADIENRPEYWCEVVLRDEGFVMEVATLSTGIPAERFEGAEMTPSAAAAIWQAVVEVNGFLHRFIARATGAGETGKPATT